MATERPLDEAPESAGAALTASPERADEIFLEGPRPRFEEFITLLRCAISCADFAPSPSSVRV
jgi:hypothetical protein